MLLPPPTSTLFPYTTLFRSGMAPPHLLTPISAPEHIVLQHRSEEHTSELQSQSNLVCRLLLEKKNYFHCPKLQQHLQENYQDSTCAQPCYYLIKSLTACLPI